MMGDVSALQFRDRESGPLAGAGENCGPGQKHSAEAKRVLERNRKQPHLITCFYLLETHAKTGHRVSLMTGLIMMSM